MRCLVYADIRDITHLVFEKDTDTYAFQRDNNVRKACDIAGVQCIVESGHTLWDVEEVINANGGRPTMTQASLLKALSILFKLI